MLTSYLIFVIHRLLTMFLKQKTVMTDHNFRNALRSSTTCLSKILQFYLNVAKSFNYKRKVVWLLPAIHSKYLLNFSDKNRYE